jgi:peptide/nickel transport system permease protein
LSLIAYIARRVLLLIPVLFAITLITFTLSHVIPGDPARLVSGLDATEEQVQRLREELGLDRPLPVQYGIYVRGLLEGDLGRSLVNGAPVRDNLGDFFPATLELALAALVLALIVGVPLGVVSAVHKDGPVDHLSRLLALAGVAMPVFWIGIILLLVFFFHLGWFPSGGRVDALVAIEHPLPDITGLLTIDSLLTGNWSLLKDAVWHLALPAFTLSLATLARVVRITRTSMLEALNQPYIATARAKGLPERRVIYVHALKNALIPVVTILGIATGFLLGGSVLVEKIFAWPGMGKYAFDSITFLDYNSILGVTLLATVVFIGVNLAVDVVYAYLDPRIRLR